MLVRAIYTLLLTLAAPFLLFGLYKRRPNKPQFGPRWKEHFGFTPPLKSRKQPIWIHAVSVGESIAATPLIKALKQENPELAILVTTTTSTGAEQIAKLGDLVEHRYMPIDFGFAINGFLNAVNPAKMLIIETELWPNTLHTVHKAGIPITVINARLSEKSRQGYARVQPLFNQLHPKLDKVLCQTESDADRFVSLGVDKEKLAVTGSIKFDIQISDEIRQQGQALRAKLGTERPVWIAASTHKGEDEQVLQAHRKLLQSHPDALLILVPRHPERFNAVYALCQEQNFNTVRRQSGELVPREAQVYLGDTMGEMLILLGAADVCFMGGSLLGDKVGGHNVLEPAALGVPVITGPSYFNFKEIMKELLQSKATLVCSSIQDISAEVRQLINDQHRYNTMQSAAIGVVKGNQGSLMRTAQYIQD